MVIYGVALLAICMLAGDFLGNLLGTIVGVEANVGGVGIAMLMVVLLVDYLKKKNRLNEKSQLGISFWSAMYVPIVVAMAAQQNVYQAIQGGPVAIAAGLSAVAISLALVPLISKIGKPNEEEELYEEQLKKAE